MNRNQYSRTFIFRVILCIVCIGTVLTGLFIFNHRSIRVQMAIIANTLLNTFTNQLSFNRSDQTEAEKEAEEEQGAAEQMMMMLRDPNTGEIPPMIEYKAQQFIKMLPKSSQENLREKNQSQLQAFNLVWQSRGPWNIGGRTRGIAIDKSNENIILAGGVTGGGIWRSTDKGKSWTRAVSTPMALGVTCFVQDVRVGKEHIWFCGTGEHRYNVPNHNLQGILMSQDGGKTWNPLASTVGKEDFRHITGIILPKNNSQAEAIIVATNAGILRSTDGGTSWTKVLTNNFPQFDSASRYSSVSASSGGVYYAALAAQLGKVYGSGTSKVYRSTNGVSWIEITPPEVKECYFLKVASAPSQPNVAYIVGVGRNTPQSHATTVFCKYTYLSGTGDGAGGQWEDRTHILKSANLSTNTQSGFAALLEVSPTNEDIVFLGGILLYRSLDGFKTTTRITPLNLGTHPDHHTIAFYSDGTMLNANDGGVYGTTATFSQQINTLQWQSYNSGYLNTQFYSIAIDETTPQSPLVLGGMQDNGTALTVNTSLSSPWASINGGDGAMAAVTTQGNDRIIYSSFQYAQLFSHILPINGSEQQVYAAAQNRKSISPKNFTDPLFINPFAIDPNNNNTVYFPIGRDIWRNNDMSALIKSPATTQPDGWQQFSGLVPAEHQISAIGASKGIRTRLFIGTTKGKVYRIDNARTGAIQAVDVSINKGLPTSGYVSAIAIDPTNEDRALLVFSNYHVQSLFYTTDAGNTWFPVGGNLEQYSDGSGNGPACLSAAIVNYRNQTLYFIGTSAGLFITPSLRGTQTRWVLEDGVPPGVAVFGIAKRDIDGTVVVGTHGAGVFSTKLDNLHITSVTHSAHAHSSSQLKVYPNPASIGSTMSITGDFTGVGQIIVRLFDVTGKEVLQSPLYDSPSKDRQFLTVPIPNNLTPGNYLCVVETETSIIARTSITLRR